MNVESSLLTVNGLPVNVVRKSIKNLHLGVYPPDGRVRVAAPLAVSDEAVRLAVVGKLGWIKRQQAKFAAQVRQSEREMVSGESHYFQGRRYHLRVLHHNAAPRIALRHNGTMELHVRRESTAAQRERALQEWYRQQLKAAVPPLLEKWQPVVGVETAQWGVRKMKTKWGTCNAEARCIWLNLELAKKPVQCLEYIVVHELFHLIERKHNDRFIALMNQHLSQWQMLRNELNAAPLAHEEWDY